MGVCVCKRTLTHSARGVPDVSPGVETRHLEGPKNPDGLNLGIYVILSVLCHTSIYILGGGMRSWTNCFLSSTYFSFRKSKAKDVNVKPTTRIPSYTDPQSRVLIYFL